MRPTVFAPSTRRAHARLTTAIALACPAGATPRESVQRSSVPDAVSAGGTTSEYRIVHLATAHGPARARRHRRSTYSTLAPRS
jgi:hypothetical protein